MNWMSLPLPEASSGRTRFLSSRHVFQQKISDFGFRIWDCGSGMFRRAPQIRNPISNVLDHHIGARIDPPFFDIVLLTPEHFAESNLEMLLPQRIHKDAHRCVRCGCDPRDARVRSDVERTPSDQRCYRLEWLSEARDRSRNLRICFFAKDNNRHTDFLSHSHQICVRPVLG